MRTLFICDSMPFYLSTMDLGILEAIMELSKDNSSKTKDQEEQAAENIRSAKLIFLSFKMIISARI